MKEKYIKFAIFWSFGGPKRKVVHLERDMSEKKRFQHERPFLYELNVLRHATNFKRKSGTEINEGNLVLPGKNYVRNMTTV
jgi:hypothetical protein